MCGGLLTPVRSRRRDGNPATTRHPGGYRIPHPQSSEGRLRISSSPSPAGSAGPPATTKCPIGLEGDTMKPGGRKRQDGAPCGSCGIPQLGLPRRSDQSPFDSGAGLAPSGGAGSRGSTSRRPAKPRRLPDAPIVRKHPEAAVWSEPQPAGIQGYRSDAISGVVLEGRLGFSL